MADDSKSDAFLLLLLLFSVFFFFLSVDESKVS